MADVCYKTFSYFIQSALSPSTSSQAELKKLVPALPHNGFENIAPVLEHWLVGTPKSAVKFAELVRAEVS